MADVLIVVGALGLWMTFLFVVSLIRRDNGTADVGYGMAFIVSACVLYMHTPAVLAQGTLVLLMVIAWGSRLSIRILSKAVGKPEDFRYRAWREEWGNTFVWRSFLQVYMLQGLVILAVSLPVLALIAAPLPQVTALFTAGFMLWWVGYFFEVVGDAQLDRFLRNKEKKTRIMTTGLWRYSRHPNYFGEALMWWSLALMAYGGSTIGLVVLISPLLITYLLLYVSGVPLLEKRFSGDPEWEAYKARTSVFIPWFPKKD